MVVNDFIIEELAVLLTTMFYPTLTVICVTQKQLSNSIFTNKLHERNFMKNSLKFWWKMNESRVNKTQVRRFIATKFQKDGFRFK